MNYTRALEFLRSRGNEIQGIHLGLHRMTGILRALGNPQEQFPALHIAGTNGKGSVAAMSESILQTSGLRTALYTSPHLVHVRERIRIEGCPVSPRSFGSLVGRVAAVESELVRSGGIDRTLTYFEFLTACAFLHFARKKVDIGVIEVGLGGLLDATNVVLPRVCVITGISFDHQEFLGNTLAKIAGEKAGIIKPGVPVISGCRAPEARRVILRKARDAGAPALEIDRDCKLEIAGDRGGRCTINLKTPLRSYRRLRLALAGAYQARNAALAVAAVEALGFGVKAGAIRSALATTRWPGRLDEYRAEKRTLLDGAHNPEGAQQLRDFLRQHNGRPIEMVFGAVRDKDIRKMSAALFPLAGRIHLTPLHNSRSASPEDIAALHPRFRNRILIHPNARAALAAAWHTSPEGALVLVTGSLYLVGELLPVVQAAAKRQARAVTRG